MAEAPVFTAKTKGPSAYSIQVAIALVVLVIGFILFTVWVVIYANRLVNDLDIEWWLWLILGFGAALIGLSLIWLVIVGYAMSSKGDEMLFELRRQRCGDGFYKVPVSDDNMRGLEPSDYTRTRSTMTNPMLGGNERVDGNFVAMEDLGR